MLQYCSFFRCSVFCVIHPMTVFRYLTPLRVPEIVCACLRNGLTWWMPCDGGGSIQLLLKGQALWLQGHCAGVRTDGPGSGPGGGTRGALSPRFFVLSLHQWFRHRQQYLACRGFRPRDLFWSNWQSKDVNAFENKVETHCHNTAYSMATAANTLSKYSMRHGYSSQHTVKIQHAAWLQQPTHCQNTAWLQQPTYCHNTAYSMATAANKLSRYSI